MTERSGSIRTTNLRRFARLAVALAALFAGGSMTACGCDRTEEPRSPSPDSASKTSTSAPQADAPTRLVTQAKPVERPSCVVPTPHDSPPTVGPADHCPAAPDKAAPMPQGFVDFLDAPGQPRISVAIAETEPARERGLMYRRSLADDAGMLFSWSDESVRTFWMHNTCIPLDMLFISKSGYIVGILEEVPTLNDDPRKVACPAGYVLEVNAGWSRGHGVRAGQRVQIETPSKP